MNLDFFGHTDIGKKRDLNEDNYLCHDFSASIPELKNRVVLLAVADGIGGHRGGDIASALAAETLKERLAQGLRESSGEPDFLRLLEESFHLANGRIYEKASAGPELEGMGTTLVAALVTEGRVFLANIGDSRAYIVREKGISQISQDHSWAEEQRRAQTLSEEDIRTSPFKHMITRSLGFEATASVDTYSLELEEGDYLLLCTDGLYGVVSTRDMARIFRKFKEPEMICGKLIQTASRLGSRDNITAVVARFRNIGEGGFLSQTVKRDTRLVLKGEREPS